MKCNLSLWFKNKRLKKYEELSLKGSDPHCSLVEIKHEEILSPRINKPYLGKYIDRAKISKIFLSFSLFLPH
jgi:hypothetical protein